MSNNMMMDDHEEETAEELAEEQALQDLVDGKEPSTTSNTNDNNNDNDDNDNREMNDDDIGDEDPDDEHFEEEEETPDAEEEGEEKEEKDDNSSDSDFESMSVKVDGIEIEVNSESELRAVVKKLTEDKPFDFNNEKELLDQSGLSEEDIALFADIKNGSKAAVNELLRRQRLTLDDLDDARDEKYEQQFKYEKVTETQILAKEIMADQTFLNDYNAEVGKLPRDFAEAIHSDATAMKHFMRHVKSGLTKEIIPAAQKAATLEGIPFMEAYARVGRELAGKKTAEQPAQKKEVKREVKEESRSRRTKRSQNRSSTPKEPTADEIYNMSEEDFVAKYGE